MIYNNVKSLRRQSELSQSELAEKIDVSRATIIAIENNKSVPGLEIALKLSYFFSLNVNDIFFDSAVKLDLQ